MNNKGFTLIELLVVVLIIGILAAMALPQYFKAVERSRMAEAVTLLGNIAQAQQRKFLQINKYTGDFRGLDVAPKGASGSTFYTKGSTPSTDDGNGFQIDIVAADTFGQGSATAVRTAGTGTLQYEYTLTRNYDSTGTICTGDNQAGADLCADFCGIDNMTKNNSCCSDGSLDAPGGSLSEAQASGACAASSSH